nr:2,4-dienoyl-CoA reductase 2 [Nephromyces sp. MMRI]AZL94561.1 2,4-dienoyl-CoA reductase 2 [Nephromyces sp. MMRI]AZL94562.1 2,4-dienoyl-CoA reductase 2 [Nephromyces sp. MMRI]AZL94566.1 2,4-dienoyl-CoA reductase 2 [Nephromyces sp. MMRI]AZL94571.1 2,4-dienoyl-CoA reductase 2 [Nephromyces sp. MMRI]
MSFTRDCLKGKVALITGGGSGIGRGITSRFMELGAQTIIVSRKYDRVKSTAEELEKQVGGSCYPVQGDVRDYNAIGKIFDHVMEKFNKVDILINCAAGNFLAMPDKLSYNAFRTVMEIDAHGSFICSQHAFNKSFSKIGGGIIINISMTLHYTGALLQTHAGTAKAGIDAMTKHLAAEWGPCGVRVNGVAPGPIAGTAGMSKLGTSKAPVPHGTSKKNDAGDDELDQLTAFIPLQRLGNQKDIANSVVFLCLPEASFITGHTLVVDGGTWLTAGNFAVLDTAVRKAWVERGKAIRAIANDTEFTSKL